MFYYSLKFDDKPYNFIGSNHAVYTYYDGWRSITGLITIGVDKPDRKLYFNDQIVDTNDFQTEVSDDYVCIEIINDSPAKLDVVLKYRWGEPGISGSYVFPPSIKVNHKGIRIFHISKKRCQPKKNKKCKQCVYLDVCDVSHSRKLDMSKIISHFNKSVIKDLDNDKIQNVKLTFPAVIRTPDMTFFNGEYLYGLRVYIPSPALFQKMMENVKNVMFGDYQREYKFLESILKM